jgi:hypothetical protein
MLKRLCVVGALTSLFWTALAIEQRHGIVVGEILKVDAGARTVVVKAADGSEYTFHFLKRTAVHGGEGAVTGSKDAFSGLKVGGLVAVHYTATGTAETAQEIDNIGKDGLKATDVTVVRIDRGAKTLAVKTADGAEQSYHLTDSAARDAGKDIGEGADQSAKVTVYYTEEGGRKVAHFFKRAI